MSAPSTPAKIASNNVRGVFCVLAVPIGNIDDITLRALQVLKNSQLILCEDTRITKKLLLLHNIPVPKLLRYKEPLTPSLSKKITDALNYGQSVTLVCDAGTPLLSDPGRGVIEYLRNLDYKITCAPGPSSLTAAIMLSENMKQPFLFLGFLPRKASHIIKQLQAYQYVSASLVCFLTPHRFTMEVLALQSLFPGCPCVLHRELTKLYETCHPTTLDKLHLYPPEQHKGEMILLINNHNVSPPPSPPQLQQLAAEVLSLSVNIGLKKAAAQLASQYNLNPRQLYQLALKLKNKEL